ncbi:hypothetical protein Bpfe_001714 [Biomphalaria pfeifferi]|uniref:Uncharacterized protein n=1 Tax=Biomphalaria pfeifferi TaxID=112525 RepID=A0AAD8FMB4_BIOPF|nr:hypothetical protein Bpfe_001714 [Biomphalaria pfeifferi]
MNQEFIRKATRIANYRQEKANLKFENSKLKKENKKLLSRLNGMKDVLSNLAKWKKVAHRRSEQGQALKDNIQSLRLSVEEAKLQVDELAEKLSDNDLSQSAQSICHAGIYDAPFRKCLYACLESQVPVEKAGRRTSCQLHFK